MGIAFFLIYDRANLGININGTGILFIPQITPKITYEHHHNLWSINEVMGCNTSVLLWDKEHSDIFNPGYHGRNIFKAILIPWSCMYKL
jgi:hypothetical protein